MELTSSNLELLLKEPEDAGHAPVVQFKPDLSGFPGVYWNKARKMVFTWYWDHEKNKQRTKHMPVALRPQFSDEKKQEMCAQTADLLLAWKADKEAQYNEYEEGEEEDGEVENDATEADGEGEEVAQDIDGAPRA